MRRGRRSRGFSLLELAVTIVVISVLVAVLLFWVRNPFGFMFIALLAALLGTLAWWAPARAAQVACAFFGIELCLSTFSRADYLFTATARTGNGAMPSDAAQIAEALFPPYWLWGGAIALLSLAILVLGLRAMLRASR